MSDYLLEDLTLQILYKLPVKSLMRYTCVCKPWYRLIKSSTFITTHVTKTTLSSKQLLFVRILSDREDKYALHLDNEEFNEYIKLQPPFSSSYQNFRVRGSSNGLVCLVGDQYYNTFILWNPLIKKSLTLPKPDFTFKTYKSLGHLVGFGFDSSSNDYKVLNIVLFGGNREEYIGGLKPVEAEVYSLNTGSWKRITSTLPILEIDDNDSFAVVNGILHCLGYQVKVEYQVVVFGFHLADEVFHEITLPERVASSKAWRVSLSTYGKSSIAVLHLEVRVSEYHLWVMTRYGVEDSWIKLVIPTEVGISRVLATRDNGELVVEHYKGHIVSYDPKSKQTKSLDMMGKPYHSFVNSYLESLLLLDIGNNANNEIENHASDEASQE